jgi:hypothetical protein
VGFAKNQKVDENCTAKQTCPEFSPKTFASWLQKFATEINWEYKPLWENGTGPLLEPRFSQRSHTLRSPKR